jgi:hypothetical protein
MSVSWSRRKREKPDHPDHARIVTGVGIDSGTITGRVVGYRRAHPAPYAPPDGEQEDDVIEPTAVFEPGQILPD